LQDLEILCHIRNFDVEGNREVILFLYRYWSCCYLGDVEDALKRTLEFNKRFKKPLSEGEVLSATNSAEKCYFDKDKVYNYYNETLIDLLGITKGEQKYLKSIISDDEKKFRKNEYKKSANKEKRRNENGLTKREQGKQEMINVVKEKLNQGLGVKAIAKELNMSVGRVSEIKNNKY